MQLEAYAHHTEDPSAIERFCELFAQIDTNKELAQEIRNTAAVQVLTDIHLFLNGASPLTSKKLKDYDGFDDVHDSSNNARASRGFVAVGESRSTAASSASSSASGAAAGAGAGAGAASAMAAANRVALNNTLRVQRLSDLYLTLPPSFVKAKAAFALGLNAQNSGHHQQAERLYFEAIYLLDGCSPTGRPTAPLISELGANCLKSYGDQLLYNYKYKYAIAAYQSCSISYQLRRRNKDYYYLLKEMAATAYRNDDVKHAIPFYKEVLQICITEKKTNEVRSFLPSFLISSSRSLILAHSFLLSLAGNLCIRRVEQNLRRDRQVPCGRGVPVGRLLAHRAQRPASLLDPPQAGAALS